MVRTLKQLFYLDFGVKGRDIERGSFDNRHFIDIHIPNREDMVDIGECKD